MRRINGPGDRDDLVAVTLAVNGGRNGYAERRALLIKAKRALAAQPAEAATPREATRAPQAASAAGPAPTHRVSAGGLNLRREPRSDRPNQIATLPQGTRVQSLGAPDAKGWVQVRVMLSGALRAGFVASEYLTPLPPGASFASESRRAQDAKRDFPVALSPSARRRPLRPGSPRSGVTASPRRAPDRALPRLAMTPTRMA